jgi:hypothetical protein
MSTTQLTPCCVSGTLEASQVSRSHARRQQLAAKEQEAIMPDEDARSPRPRDWPARGLALLALVGAVVAWASIPAPTDPTTILSHELAAPSTRAICPMPPGADPTNLTDVMETGFSPLMGKISFTLHHDQRSSRDEKRAVLVDSTAKMLGCIQLAAGTAPSSQATLRDHYVGMMLDLRDTVALLQLTAVEDDLENSRHWYDHTRKQCARCHLLYKPGE